jgi:ribosomal protein S18 acetylase RimI-like enzyme
MTAQHLRSIHVVRVAPAHWHALEDDGVVGRGHATYRPDGRTYVSVDAWNTTTFDLLAGAVVRDLPRPLHTLVDEADVELTDHWRRHGFTQRRREWEHVVPTDPDRTGLAGARPPRATTIRTADERFTVAEWGGERLGHVRVAPVPHRPVVGWIEVRPDVRRLGIARALLAHALGALHERGVPAVSAMVDETDAPAVALVGGLGGERTTSQLELVLDGGAA